MTIITKSLSEKKPDKLEVPLVDSEATVTNVDDVEAQTPPDSGVRMIVIPARIRRRISTAATFCLLLTALVVVGIGMVGGLYFYQQFIRTEIRFKGWCNIPLNEDGKASKFIGQQQKAYEDFDFKDLKFGNFLREQFEIDLERHSYETIDVPDFQDGRSGRFIHDFNTNMTGIVDNKEKRCFVMPLNRGDVLPPQSLYDLIHKMWDGYYKVNTKVVHETMHITLPALTLEQLKRVGTYIARECYHFPVYKLEKYIDKVVKRSAEIGQSGSFMEFAGNNIVQFNIVNLGEAKGFQEEVVAS